MKDNYINHIVFVLDASGSMAFHAQELVKVADNQIAHLAERSRELNQETRVTVYTFNETARCLVYDKDVLRVPSIEGLYYADGQTALVDATILAIGDLAMTPEKYGEHAFLLYILTDGQENSSRIPGKHLSDHIKHLPENWTLAAFVPNQNGIFEAKKFGFPKENISVWDTSSTQGVNEAGAKIKEATEIFMQSRRMGVRGTKNLFSLSMPSLATVTTVLPSLHAGQFRMLDVQEDGRIDEFVESHLHRSYHLGEAYYQLTKPETIQPQKRVALYANSRVYTGDEARQLLGLPQYDVRVRPADYPDYEIFVQSTSVNRKLIAGTRLLILS